MPKVKTYAYVRKLTSTSRGKANCTVSGCDVSTRMDKLKKHFQQSVLWDDNNSACCQAFSLIKLKSLPYNQRDHPPTTHHP